MPNLARKFEGCFSSLSGIGVIIMSENRSFFGKISMKFKRLFAGVDTPVQFLIFCITYPIYIILRRKFKLHTELQKKCAINRIVKKYLRNGVYVIKEAYLPQVDTRMYHSFCNVFVDTLFVYAERNDNYDEADMDSLFDCFCEGPYGLRNPVVDVRVKPGDIVIDAGSWIGDFAAYASAKGAQVYAFEPSESTYNMYLRKTAELNKRITTVKKGLGDSAKTVYLTDDFEYSGSNRLISECSTQIANSDLHLSGKQLIEITTIDDFVRERKLTRVDFIKADIEGQERYMLKGAAETLRKYAPKLAICTYHLPDDPEVLADIIKKTKDLSINNLTI
jgi:FkbM family methyltransferase